MHPVWNLSTFCTYATYTNDFTWNLLPPQQHMIFIKLYHHPSRIALFNTWANTTKKFKIMPTMILIPQNCFCFPKNPKLSHRNTNTLDFFFIMRKSKPIHVWHIYPLFQLHLGYICHIGITSRFFTTQKKNSSGLYHNGKVLRFLVTKKKMFRVFVSQWT